MLENGNNFCKFIFFLNRLWNNNNVKTWLQGFNMRPRGISQQSLDPVSLDSFLGKILTDRKTNSSFRIPGWRVFYGDSIQRQKGPFGIYSREIFAFGQSVFFG